MGIAHILLQTTDAYLIKQFKLLILAVFCTSVTFPHVEAQVPSYDVVVIGGTPGGIAAAITAGRMGKTVMLVEQSPVLGGMLASGVLRLDDHIKEASSGVMEEFRQRVKSYHLTELSDDPLVQAHAKLPSSVPWNATEGQVWEPRTAVRIYGQMVKEIPAITTRFNQVPVDVQMEGNRAVAVVTQERNNDGVLGEQHTYTGQVIIDATYEGDLAEFAGVPYRIGREARSPEEPHAGVIYTDGFGSKPGVLKGTIFPGSTGEADHRTQAFTFRMTGKDYGREDHPFRLMTPPDNYDANKYKWNPNQQPIVPNGKFDLLGINYGADLAGHSTRYILSDWEERVAIEKIFRDHSLGWLYYIQTEGGSPNVGLADDEFVDNHHFPYRLYVRQGRRIEGLYTLNESDLHKDLRGNGIRPPLQLESIAIGMYPIDAHNVQNPTDRNAGPYGEGAAEGDIHLEDVTGPYQIPYGAMVPANHQGLLFPVGISSTHLAMSSVRMEPVWSSLGQAAGVAAVLSIDGNTPLGQVNVTAIQDELIRQGSFLFFYKDLTAEAPEFAAVQKLSLLGAIDGDDNYYLRAKQPITMGDFARLVIKGLQLPISITAAHFEDVPRGHPAFKYMESLYDYSTQSSAPFFEYEVRNYLSYWWGARSVKGPPAYAYPDHAVTGEMAARILSGLLGKNIGVSTASDAVLSRGEAAMLMHEVIQQNE
ncbi:MAG: FAD-dependent oxidoreductase [Saprospiraceae bacterium]|nr:FAD-dependent oxidoreductase [Saprospiraceae bacterium]